MELAGRDEIRKARIELDEVINEIRKVPGYEKFLVAPTFDDIAMAAREQPLVYITAADLGGLALVVRNTDVVHVPLARLTRDAVDARVGVHRDSYFTFCADERAGLAAWNAALDVTTKWLWDEVMGPIVEELQLESRAVLVAGGLLGLLPLHAAWTEDAQAPTGRRHALDAVALSYTPNARSLTAARGLAGTATQRLLAVVDTSTLPSAAMEVRAAAAGFSDPVTISHSPAPTADDVTTAMTHADVAHFACHGYADLMAPLDSGLRLPGGAVLRLRDLLTVSLGLRLAVLSACETSLPGTQLPDEVVSLPTGLLQAGVGGIVASQWRVPDSPTTTLMTAFYRQWRHEKLAPPAALQRAQQWLRDTTNEQKIRDYEEALAAGAAWLPEDVAEHLFDHLAFAKPDARDDAGLAAWAAFAYFGT